MLTLGSRIRENGRPEGPVFKFYDKMELYMENHRFGNFAWGEYSSAYLELRRRFPSQRRQPEYLPKRLASALLQDARACQVLEIPALIDGLAARDRRGSGTPGVGQVTPA